MTEVEFAAVADTIRTLTQINAWQPTDEELHRLFWSAPLPALDPSVSRTSSAPPDFWTRARAQGLDVSAVTTAAVASQRTPVDQPLPEAAKELRWRVEVLAGDRWWPVQQTDSSSSIVAEHEMAEHKKAQPHTTFRVVSFRT